MLVESWLLIYSALLPFLVVILSYLVDSFPLSIIETNLALLAFIVLAVHLAREGQRFVLYAQYILIIYHSIIGLAIWGIQQQGHSMTYWLFFLFITLISYIAADYIVPIPNWPALSGPYKSIGMAHFYINQREQHQTLFTKEHIVCNKEEAQKIADQELELVVTVFYPSSLSPPTQPSSLSYMPYEHAAAIASFIQIPAFLLAHLTKIKSPAILNAPLLHHHHDNDKDLAAFPMILYSHGLGGSAYTYQIQACDLASHGYIVFLCTHNDRSASLSRFPDGRCLYIEAQAEQDQIVWRNNQLIKRVEEISFLLDLLSTDNNRLLPFNHPNDRHLQSLLSYCDSSKIAVIGHSFGAATAVSLAMIEQETREALGLSSRIGCIITHDQWMTPQHYKTTNIRLKTPILVTVSEEFYSWPNMLLHYQAQLKLYRSFLPLHIEAKRMFYIAETQHSNFSDVPLFSSYIAKKINKIGPIDHEYVWSLLNAYNWQWCHLCLQVKTDEKIDENLFHPQKKPKEVIWLQ